LLPFKITEIRRQLEGSRLSNPDNVGEALNKILCDQWLKEIGGTVEPQYNYS